MTIGAIRIRIGNAKGSDIEVTMRGAPEKIVEVLITGLPREALVQIKRAIDEQMQRRAVDTLTAQLQRRPPGLSPEARAILDRLERDIAACLQPTARVTKEGK